jgi:hypothetical protein
MGADRHGLVLSATAASAADELYFGHLAPIDLADFGKRPLSPRPGELWEDSDDNRTVCSEALLELSDLIDEVRFLASLGAGLCWEYLERRGSADTSSSTADVPPADGDMAAAGGVAVRSRRVSSRGTWVGGGRREAGVAAEAPPQPRAGRALGGSRWGEGSACRPTGARRARSSGSATRRTDASMAYRHRVIGCARAIRGAARAPRSP